MTTPTTTFSPPNLTRNPLAGVCICVDGPTASGKGTLAKQLARHWRLKFLDTGTLYRAVAWHVLAQGHDPSIPALAEAAAIALVAPGGFDFKHLGNNDFAVFIRGENVSAPLRTLEIGQAAPIVAVQPAVRAALLELQQNFVATWQPLVGVVLDGRDCGGRIAPHAQVKLFLTADVAERGRRRWLEATAQGQLIGVDNVIAQVASRDARDAHNLIQTPEAVVLDGTHISAAEVLQLAIRSVEAKLGRVIPAAPRGD